MANTIKIPKLSELNSKADDPHGNPQHSENYVSEASFGLSEILTNGNVSGGNGIYMTNEASIVFEDSDGNSTMIMNSDGIVTLGSSTSALLDQIQAGEKLIPPKKSDPTTVSAGLVFDTTAERLVYRYDSVGDSELEQSSNNTTKNTL